MIKSEMRHLADRLDDMAAGLTQIDFAVPVEPRDDASADEWRDYGLEVADKLAEAEKVTLKISEQLQE
ncbi:hypothetical protein [Dinoroseobacter sp. S375]|uniref:hypothetical protein n=1 Tax=Dinoroseobacter sp. S375 TaxID=3415136 RepID=UPI003C79DCDF